MGNKMISEHFSPVADRDTRWDMEDDYERAQDADARRRTPNATRNIMGALAARGIRCGIENMGGGCMSLVIPIDDETQLLIGTGDCSLVYLGSDIYIGLDRFNSESNDTTPILSSEWVSADAVAAVVAAVTSGML